MKKTKFETSRDAIKASGTKAFPEIIFDDKIKFNAATTTPNNNCLFFDDGDVIGSGSITIEKKITVGLSNVDGNVFNEMPEFTKVKIT